MVVALLVAVLVAVLIAVLLAVVVIAGEWSVDMDSFSCGDLFPPFSRFEK